jgi:hypothetical protein
MTTLLPTWTGLSDPQAALAGSRAVLGLPPQVSFQSTPRFGPSLLTEALTFAEAPTITEEIVGLGGLGSVTEMPVIVGLVDEHPANPKTTKHKKVRNKAFDNVAHSGKFSKRLPLAA